MKDRQDRYEGLRPEQEGQRAITRKTSGLPGAKESSAPAEEKIDPRRMIIYSELLKPKFDEL